MCCCCSKSLFISKSRFECLAAWNDAWQSFEYPELSVHYCNIYTRADSSNALHFMQYTHKKHINNLKKKQIHFSRIHTVYTVHSVHCIKPGDYNSANHCDVSQLCSQLLLLLFNLFGLDLLNSSGLILHGSISNNIILCCLASVSFSFSFVPPRPLHSLAKFVIWINTMNVCVCVSYCWSDYTKRAPSIHPIL